MSVLTEYTPFLPFGIFYRFRSGKLPITLNCYEPSVFFNGKKYSYVGRAGSETSGISMVNRHYNTDNG